jgi:hypothetical protein
MTTLVANKLLRVPPSPFIRVRRCRMVSMWRTTRSRRKYSRVIW